MWDNIKVWVVLLCVLLFSAAPGLNAKEAMRAAPHSLVVVRNGDVRPPLPYRSKGMCLTAKAQLVRVLTRNGIRLEGVTITCSPTKVT